MLYTSLSYWSLSTETLLISLSAALGSTNNIPEAHICDLILENPHVRTFLDFENTDLKYYIVFLCLIVATQDLHYIEIE